MLVSIITPVFNQAKYISQAIESVLAQNYPHIEYIVIDDGSTDGTHEIIASYAGKIHIERHDNMGQARTLNKGWAMCKGQILGYLSADDVLLPDAVSRAVAFLESESDVVMVYPDCDLIDPSSSVIRHSVARETDYEELVVGQECYVGPGAFFRRLAYEKAGGWDDGLRVAPDREFWMRLGLLGRIAMIPEVLALYRMHPRSISYFHSTAEDAREYLSVVEKYFKRNDLPESIPPRKNEALCRSYIVSARIHVRGGRFLEALRCIITARRIYHTPALPICAMMLRTLLSRHYHRCIWQLRDFFFSRKRNSSKS